jgi:dihydrodipicolinate synthase/N-acetylneuraminate lyase
MLGSGVVNARLIRKSLDALAAGDDTAAEAWQARSNALLLDLFRPDIGCWLAGLKYAMVRLGLFGTETMHLGFQVDDTDRRRIDAALDRERAEILPPR